MARINLVLGVECVSLYREKVGVEGKGFNYSELLCSVAYVVYRVI